MNIILGLLGKLAIKLVTEQVLESLVHLGLRKLSESTKSDVDDSLLKIYEDATGRKK